MTTRKTKVKKPTQSADTRVPSRIHSLPVTEENELVPEESLAEAESEIGQNDWIDPETGELAEGEAPPHFDAE